MGATADHVGTGAAAAGADAGADAAHVIRLVAALVASGLVVSGFNRTDAGAAAGVRLQPDAAATLDRFEFEQRHMGTTARVVLYTHSASRARNLADHAFARIAALDTRLSDYRTDSELMALCRSAGGPPIAVSEDLYTVLSAAQRLSERTGGAFDVTVGPLSRLWRRARVTGEPPDASTIAAATALVGHQHIKLLSARTVQLAMPGMLLDLGGIAKGYAADEALTALRDRGATQALVAIAGDIAAGDAPAGKEGWVVSVAPLGPAVRTSVAPLTLRRAALSTSGDAEQYLERNGTRYSHILTPPTGQAVIGRRGVTVLAPDGMTADALATAVSVLGNERGLALVDNTPGGAAVILETTQQGIREYRSSRW